MHRRCCHSQKVSRADFTDTRTYGRNCSGSRDVVSALLEDEANPSLRDKVHGTPLEKAVGMGRAGKDVLEVLIEYEAKADLSRRSYGVHILH